MKLRLDEYYYIISDTWEEIEDYMPVDMAAKLEELYESDNQDEILNYLENLYSHIEVIDTEYEIDDLELDASRVRYIAIIKIGDKYYSFGYWKTRHWYFKDKVDVDEDLTEVFPKEITTTIYEPKQS